MARYGQRITVVDVQNIQHVPMQALEHCHEFRSRPSNMCMSVDGLERREFGEPQLVLVIGSQHPAEHLPETGPAQKRRLS